MNAFNESKFRQALRTAKAARADGLADDGPFRIRDAIATIENAIQFLGGPGIGDREDVAYFAHKVSYAHIALQLYAAKRKKASRRD